MAETILTPGQEDSQEEQTQVVNNSNYLIKDNMLSEFETESEKSVARYNLGVPAAEDVYTKEEVEPVIIDRIKKKIAESLDSSDFITRVAVETLLENFVRLDGTTPFTST
jgi:predicted choloylglycine hydrolase